MEQKVQKQPVLKAPVGKFDSESKRDPMIVDFVVYILLSSSTNYCAAINIHLFIVKLDDRNNIVNMEDPFGGDDNYVVDEGEDGTEGDEILDETGDESDGEEHVEPAGEGGEDQEGNQGEDRQDGAGTVREAAPGGEANVQGREDIDHDRGMDGGGETEEGGGADMPEEVDGEPVVSVKHPDNMYRAVRSVMSGGQDPVKLNPRMKYGRGEDPGFMTPGDKRILRNANMCNMEDKRISSASFDPVSGRCFTCLNGDHPAWAAREGGPICIVLSDQHFPANIPADSADECMRILRIENGTLTELADELLKIAPKEGIPKGSVILNGSTAYLGVISAEK
jgi:hypothetical protein